MGPLGDSEEYDLTIGSSNQFEYAAPTAQEIADQLEAAEEETLHGLTLFRYNDVYQVGRLQYRRVSRKMAVCLRAATLWPKP
jgi:hypothetical protein